MYAMERRGGSMKNAGIIMQFCLMIALIGIWVAEFYYNKTSNEFILGALAGLFVGIGGFETIKEIDEPKKE